jgi:hypothetical protein
MRDLTTFGKSPIAINANVIALPKKEEEKKGEKTKTLPGEIVYPFTAYGRTALPKKENVVFRNATLWTCENGTIQEGDLWVKDGKIAAVGKVGLVTADMVKPGAIVIDVGMNRGADGKLCGDVDFAGVQEVAGAITPVPGGVGPMTRAMLLVNTIEAAERAAG